MIPFPDWAPDRSKFDMTVTGTATNVVPMAGLPPDPATSGEFGGYGPFPTIAPVSAALAAQPRGAIMVRDDSGDQHIFVGTTTKLYKYNTATLVFDDKTTAATTYAVPTGENWSFDKFGLDVIATNKTDGPYVWTLGSSSTFLALGGSPPLARIVGVMGDFVFLGETSTQSRQLRWSGVNNDAFWTVRQRLSDYQIFPDGDPITGFVGFERGGLVFQRRAIREVIPALETDMIFQFRKTAEEHGCIAPSSIIRATDGVFYLSENGFYRYGTPPVNIGNNRVNKYFFDDINVGDTLLVQGVADPRYTRVYWRYRSSSHASATTTDKVLVYDYGLDRWSLINVVLSWIIQSSLGSYNLDTMDSLGNLDTLGMSLDDPALSASVPVVAALDTSYKLAFFTGGNMAATLQTGEPQMTPQKRTFVRGFRPVADASGTSGRIAVRDSHGLTQAWKASASASSVTGVIPARASGLLHKFELTIPASTVWTYAHGVEPDARGEGRQ